MTMNVLAELAHRTLGLMTIHVLAELTHRALVLMTMNVLAELTHRTPGLMTMNVRAEWTPRTPGPDGYPQHPSKMLMRPPRGAPEQHPAWHAAMSAGAAPGT